MPVSVTRGNVTQTAGRFNGTTSLRNPGVSTKTRPQTEPYGTTLSQLLSDAGFSGDSLRKMWAISMKESTGRPWAHNFNLSTGDDSYGLFQINMLGGMGPERRKQYGLTSDQQLLNPFVNARVAYIMSGAGTHFGDWNVDPRYSSYNPEQAAIYQSYYNQFPSSDPVISSAYISRLTGSDSRSRQGIITGKPSQSTIASTVGGIAGGITSGAKAVTQGLTNPGSLIDKAFSSLFGDVFSGIEKAIIGSAVLLGGFIIIVIGLALFGFDLRPSGMSVGPVGLGEKTKPDKLQPESPQETFSRAPGPEAEAQQKQDESIKSTRDAAFQEGVLAAHRQEARRQGKQATLDSQGLNAYNAAQKAAADKRRADRRKRAKAAQQPHRQKLEKSMKGMKTAK
jgi:hypothetical protein